MTTTMELEEGGYEYAAVAKEYGDVLELTTPISSTAPSGPSTFALWDVQGGVENHTPGRYMRIYKMRLRRMRRSSSGGLIIWEPGWVWFFPFLFSTKTS